MLDSPQATVQAASKPPQPASLEAKFKLMMTLPYDARIKRRHMLVFGFLLDWYHRKYGDALASVRHIVAQLKERDPAGAGLYTGDVHSALKDLTAWGYITATVGSGRQASRYVPVWELGRSVRDVMNSTDEDHSVRETPNTSVREAPNTTADSVQETPNEDPSTRPGHQTRELVGWELFDAAAAPPPPDGLVATGAGAASGGAFDSFWRIWPRKHGKKKAQAEWEKLDPEQRENAITQASRWADHYRRHDTPMKYVAEPANWLRDERFDEDLPLVHVDSKGAAVSKAKANAPLKKAPVAEDASEEDEYAEDDSYEDPAPLPMINDVGMFSPIGTFEAAIVHSRVDVFAGVGEQITLVLNTAEGSVNHRFFSEAKDYQKQERGQAFLRQLADLVGLSHIDDTDQLHGLTMAVTITPQLEIKYAPARQKEAA